MKYPLILGCTAALVCLADAAVAKSPAKIEQIAKAVSVEMLAGVGSGVIIHRQGVGASLGDSPYVYTVITNRHVVCGGKGLCDQADLRMDQTMRTADGQMYKMNRSAVKLLKDAAGKKLDLAIASG